MNQDLANYLTKQARLLGFHLAKQHRANENGYNRQAGDWKDFELDSELRMEVRGGGVYRFYHSRYAWIELKDIVLVDIVNADYGETRILGGKTIDNQSTEIVNNSSAPQKRTYSVEVGESTTSEVAIGTQLTLGIKQTIGTGEAAPIKAELEISTELTQSFNYTTGKQYDSSRTTQTEIEVPPNKAITVTTQRRVSDVEQDITCKCHVDYKISIFSDKDFRYDFNSKSQLKEVLSGYGQTTGGAAYKDTPRLAEHFRSIGGIPEEHYQYFFISDDERLESTITITYQNSTSGNVLINERNIE